MFYLDEIDAANEVMGQYSFKRDLTPEESEFKNYIKNYRNRIKKQLKEIK